MLSGKYGLGKKVVGIIDLGKWGDKKWYVGLWENGFEKKVVGKMDLGCWKMDCWGNELTLRKWLRVK